MITNEMTFEMDTTTPARIGGPKSGTGKNQALRRKKKIKLDKEIIGSKMMMNYFQFGGDSQGR